MSAPITISVTPPTSPTGTTSTTPVKRTDSEKLQSVADALLLQLSSPDKMSQAISFVRETNTLQWMSKHPELFGRFLGTCAARNYADIIEHAAVVCPGCLSCTRDKHGNTLLHVGARHGSLLTINRLLDLGADPRIANDKKETVLHVMARRTSLMAQSRSSNSLTDSTSDTEDDKKHHHFHLFRRRSRSVTSSPVLVPIPPPGKDTGKDTEGDNPQPFHREETLSCLDDDDIYKQTPECDTQVGDAADDDADVDADEKEKKEKRKKKKKHEEEKKDVDDVDDVSDYDDYGDDLESNMIMMAFTASGNFKDPEVPPSTSPVSTSPTPDKKDKEKKVVDWNKFSEDGSLQSTVQRMKPEDQLAFTVQRLCQSIDPNAKNILGKTPLQLALKYNNEVMVAALQVCGATAPNELGKVPSKKSLMKSLAYDATGRYMQSIRDVLDKGPHREPLCRIVLKPHMKYRVLSMDGGGIRTLMHPIIIRRILERYPNFLDNTALFCGCSGSAAMVCMFVCGYSPQQVGECCELSAMATLKKAEGNGITGVKYTSQWLRLMADIVFGDARIKDLTRQIMIPTYLLDNGPERPDEQRKSEALFFNNIVPNSTSEAKLTEICLRSSAAPTYFRCFQGYVDGGVFANNPSACAWPVLLATAPNGLGIQSSDIVCLSLGTGASHKRYFDDERVIDGGAYHWGMSLLDLFGNSSLDFNDACGRTLLGDRYYRHVPYLVGQGPITLDDWKCAPILKKYAEDVPLDSLFAWIEKNW